MFHARKFPRQSHHLFQALTHITIPIGIDDISEKAQETWKEMVIDQYNNILWHSIVTAAVDGKVVISHQVRNINILHTYNG